MNKLYFTKMEGDIIGLGSEGRVYKLNDNTVAKYFYYETVAENKIEKIKLIKDMNIKNITKPKEIIYINDVLKGYTMDYINNKMHLKHYLLSDNSIENKITLLKQAEKIMKDLHKNDIVLVDCFYHNFLLNDMNLTAVDIDNYYVKGFDTDFIPHTIYDSYIENINDEITSDMDKYNNTLFVLYYLTNGGFDMRKVHGDINFFKKFIKKLKISKNLKQLLIEIMSDSTNKPYLEDNIDELKTLTKKI